MFSQQFTVYSNSHQHYRTEVLKRNWNKQPFSRQLFEVKIMVLDFCGKKTIYHRKKSTGNVVDCFAIARPSLPSKLHAKQRISLMRMFTQP